MSEKKLTEEELAKASGGAQYTLSSQKTENRGSFGEGGAEGASQGGDRQKNAPQVMDNGQIAISGG